MAIWQFEFYLRPRSSVLKKHGLVPAVLEEDRTIPEMLDFDIDQEFPNYWAGIEKAKPALSRINARLDPMPSWSEDAVMFGSPEGSKIEIWNDDFVCCVDATCNDIAHLAFCVEIAKELDCLISLKGNGEVLEPEFELLLDRFENSIARKFVMDPRKTLVEHSFSFDVDDAGNPVKK